MGRYISVKDKGTKQRSCQPNDKEFSVVGLLRHKSHFVQHLLALNLLAERWIRIHLQRLIVTLPSHFGSEAPLYSTKSGQIWQPQALFMIERSSSSQPAVLVRWQQSNMKLESRKDVQQVKVLRKRFSGRAKISVLWKVDSIAISLFVDIFVESDKY